jgi:hypothetical protein
MRGLRYLTAAIAALSACAFAYSQQPDLTIVRVLGTNAPSNPFTLTVGGSVDVVIQNIGTAASTPCSVVVFTDMNANGLYDAGTDIAVGHWKRACDWRRHVGDSDDTCIRSRVVLGRLD